MADINKVQQKEVKLEDLLRLKRAERPDDAFWNTFDRELHQRMLQTLVKKDPWYLQLLRGVSGRIAQTTAVGAAAVFLAMLVVRPALVETVQPAANASFAQQSAQTTQTMQNAPVEVAMSDFEDRFGNALAREYAMDSLNAAGSSSELGYTREYALDTFEVAAYDSAAYITDTAVFASTTLATSLVY